MHNEHRTIDLNADLGEGFAFDAEIISLVSSVNIACGGHAGDERTMRETVKLAKAAGVRIGAHPGFVDRAGFGRKAMAVSDDEIFAFSVKQIADLVKITQELLVPMQYVKPHGALYHLLATEEVAAKAFVRAIQAVQEAFPNNGANIAVMTLAHGALARVAKENGVRVLAEGFADRRYEANGQLTPRALGADAMIEDPNEAAEQVLYMIEEGFVHARTGERVPINVQSICVHGDGAQAVAQLQKIRTILDRNQIRIAANG